jgi:hypothetical protein
VAQRLLDEDPDLSREQAGAFLKVSPATLAEWASAKKGPRFYDYGQGAMYPLSELRRWRQEQPMKGGISPPQPEPAPEQRHPSTQSIKRRGRPRIVALA